ncbi:hypothetical protein MTHERMOG20_23610 [Moorella thermoacetica]|nr:hypothetical protein MTHERMOG20_23610 [Moorella thermoacetica]
MKRERHGDEQMFQMCRHSEEQTAPVGPNRHSRAKWRDRHGEEQAARTGRWPALQDRPLIR